MFDRLLASPARPAALGLLCAAVLLLAALSQASPVYAVLEGAKACVGPGGSSTASAGDIVICTLTIEAEPADIPAGTTITITAVGNNYTFAGATCAAEPGDCTAQVLPNAIVATCTAAACTEITIEETLTITAIMPETISQRVSVSTPTPSITVTDPVFRLVSAGTQFFVATTGNDANNCQTRATACRTANRALEVARDGDTIQFVAGTYQIDKPIVVRKLVTIQPEGSAKVVLKAKPGITLFEVWAQGGPNLRVSIRNFTMGGNFEEGSSAPVFLLSGDSYTEIANNIIGGADLPINNGIVISNSLRPTIRTNTFLGNTQTVFTPVLIVGGTVSGFGVVSFECLGGSGYSVSSGVEVADNAFTGRWTAGVWLCSDGGGEHRIRANVMRNYWRAIALKDVTNTTVADNVLVGGLSDAIILYGASLHNRIENNHVESHVGVGAAGIRVGWVADPLMPLDNLVTGNRVLRNTVGIHVFGARTTVITSNIIKISGIRTGILLTPSTFLGDPGTQPRDTEITNNEIIFIGPCMPVIGCGIRLLGVIVPVLATNNDWGLRRPLDVEGVIWHQVDDPVVGLATFMPFQNMTEPAATANGPSPTPSSAGSRSPAPNGTPSPTPNGTPGPTPDGALVPVSAGATGRSTSPPAPVRNVPLSRGCTELQWPGVTGTSVADAAMAIAPASAQRTATIWRKAGPTGWQVWRVGEPVVSTNVFTLSRGDTVTVCVQEAATWMIVTQVDGS
jgi:hypothetical protein